MEAAGAPVAITTSSSTTVLEPLYKVAVPGEGWFGQGNLIHDTLYIPSEHAILTVGKWLTLWKLDEEQDNNDRPPTISHLLSAGEGQHVAYDATRRSIFVASYGGLVQMFNLSADCTHVKEYPPLTFEKERSSVPCLAVFYNKGNDYVLAIRSDATMLLFDFGIYEKRIIHLAGFSGQISSIAYDDEHHRLFLGSYNGTVTLFDIAGRKLATFKGHTGSVKTLAYDPRTNTLFSGGFDNTLRSWLLLPGWEDDAAHSSDALSKIDPKDTDYLADVITSIAPSPDPTKVLVACGRKIFLFNSHPETMPSNETTNPYLFIDKIDSKHTNGISRLCGVPEQLLLFSTGKHQVRAWRFSLPIPPIEKKKLMQVSNSPYAPSLKAIYEDEFRRSLRKGTMDSVLLDRQKMGKLDVNTCDRATGETSLHIVCFRGDFYSLQTLLGEGRGDPFIKNNKDGQNVFHYIATLDPDLLRYGEDEGGGADSDLHVRKIKTLDTLVSYIGRERRRNTIGGGGKSSNSAASGTTVSSSNRKRMKMMLKEGDFKGRTPLHVAVECLKMENKGTDKEKRLNPSAQTHPWREEKNFVKHFIRVYESMFSEKGLREILNKADDLLCTPLHHTAQLREYPSLLRFMLAHGADVNLQDKKGSTALHRAVRRSCCKAVKLMLQAQGDVNMLDDKGNAPLHYAAALVDKKILRLLLESKQCYTTIRNNRGKTPGEIATAFSPADKEELARQFSMFEKEAPEGFLEAQKEIRKEQQLLHDHEIWERRHARSASDENMMTTMVPPSSTELFKETAIRHPQTGWTPLLNGSKKDSHGHSHGHSHHQEEEERRRKAAADKYHALLDAHADWAANIEYMTREQLESLGNIFRRALEQVDSHLGS